jgi:very-short-patch-repair endonuclease
LANDKARALRKRLTAQEAKVWVKLRELKALGFHFRRQAPIGPYIVDFAALSARVVIEIDGSALTTSVTNSFSLGIFALCDTGIRT